MISACENYSRTEEVNFDKFSIMVPATWEQIDIKSIDSNVKGFKTDPGDTILIDYGRYANPFNEIIRVRSLDQRKLYDSLGIKYPSDMVFSENVEVEQLQAIYLREYFYYDTIDRKKAKLGFPKKVGEGFSLIHFPYVDNEGNKLSIYGNNLDSLTQIELKKALKTIKFK
jgi:hypothetical protein